MRRAATRRPAARKGAARKRTTTKATTPEDDHVRSRLRSGPGSSGGEEGRAKEDSGAGRSESPEPESKPARPSVVRSAAVAVKGRLAGAVAAVKQKTPWAGEPDAITFLETDHRRLEDLLAQGEKTTARAAKARTRLLDALAAELNVHEMMEEQLLYPALEPHPEVRDIVLEGVQEHHVADVIMKELHTLSRSHEQWGAKWKVLKESIEHHIQEEENKMFPSARGVLGAGDLLSIGQRMARMKADAGLQKRA